MADWTDTLWKLVAFTVIFLLTFSLVLDGIRGMNRGQTKGMFSRQNLFWSLLVFIVVLALVLLARSLM